MAQQQVYQGAASVGSRATDRKTAAVLGKKIGIGLIGAGGMGRLVAQKVLAQDPRLEIRGVFDPDRRSVEATLNSLAPRAAVFKDYHKLCESPDMDWVMIASWNCFHTNCNSAIPERRMYIAGTEGAIRGFPDGAIEVARIGFGEKIRVVKASAEGSHGGGDDVLARELSQSMLKGVAPAVGLDEGLASAFTCFGIDEAMETGRVVEMSKYWKMVANA